MNCPKCGSLQVSSEYHGSFNCGTLTDRRGVLHHTVYCDTLAEFRKPLDAQIKQLESERDALQDRVNRLEEAGDALQSAVVGVEGMTHWQWLATAHEADLKWRAAKESKP